MVKSAFLRSINIQLDVGHPTRLEHFRPTSKSIRLVSALLNNDGGNALFVVAPYGSGKSLTAAYIGELVENRPEARDLLSTVEARITRIDATLGSAVRRRRRKGAKGLFVPLYGHVPSAPNALREGILSAMRRSKLGRQARTVERIDSDAPHDAFELISECTEKLQQSGYDRIVIVWDEFGRHLQGLISEGRPEELDVLQVLAEVINRSDSVPVSLVLLLHRSLLGYATGLPSGVKREWAKVEGRFETLQYVDDSSELYELIGSLVDENGSSETADVDFSAQSARAREVGLFPDVDERRLAELLASANPLEPSTLYLLPRVSARVAQNERTLFSFLEWVSLEEPVTPGAIYDYFRGDFRTDGGAGGTQRPWLETESALQKVPEGSTEAEALKAAFLLGLGLGGERAHATFAQLAFSLSPTDETQAAEIVDRLIDQKLLVHRRHSDQVVVWHGTDVDLRGRLDDEKRRSVGEFNLAPFLTREMPPPVWRPVEYNARHGIRRYLESEYTTVDGLRAFLSQLTMAGGWDAGLDGRVMYVLPRGPEEVVDAVTLAKTISDPRLFTAIASEVGALTEAAMDLWCLLRMHTDRELIASDPLIRAELDHLTDDARTGLQPLVDRVLIPQAQGSQWFHMGEHVRLTSAVALRQKLSVTMTHVFNATPEIDSEMIVRRSPTAVVVNARKKVELGLLERYGQEDVGIEGSFADKAIFRSVFLRTGLYRRARSGWSLANPEEIDLHGLAAVWGKVRDFFVEPGKAKSFRAFIDELRNPPHGVREGLIPLLIAAGVKAFPTAMAIRRRGMFVDDLLPSVIEDVARSPDDYVLDVVGLNAHQEQYLRGLLKIFACDSKGPPTKGSDLLRQCMDAALAWRHDLPTVVSESRALSTAARAFDRELATPDPVRLFLEIVPDLLGVSTRDVKKLLREVRKLRQELESIGQIYLDEAVEALKQMLATRGIRNGLGVREQAARWASHFPKSFTQSLPDRVTQGVLGRLKAPYDDDGALVDALSTLLLGRPIRSWDDSAVPSFRRQLRSAFEIIEATALSRSREPDLHPTLRDGLASLAEAKATTIAVQLAEIIGPEAAAERLERIAIALRTEQFAETD